MWMYLLSLYDTGGSRQIEALFFLSIEVEAVCLPQVSWKLVYEDQYQMMYNVIK